MSTELRIKRTSRWEFDATHGPMSYGGDNSYRLVHTDVLQYKNSYPTVNGVVTEWLDVPIVAEEPPENPNELRRKRQFRGVDSGIGEALKLKTDPEILKRMQDAVAVVRGEKKVQE